LADYLEPNQYDWRLREGEYTTCIWDSTLMRARGEYGGRLIRRKIRKEQIHFYGNRDFLQNINDASGTDFVWGELFRELFRPGKELTEAIKKKKEEIGCPYISAVFRFQNLLGDFKEYKFQALENDKKREELIIKCLNGLSELQKRHPNMPILVTSDSSTFIDRASEMQGVFVIEGKRVHIGCMSGAAYDTYLKSFVDFYMLADSQRVFSLGTSEMYPTQFPMYAAKVNDVTFERILLE